MKKIDRSKIRESVVPIILERSRSKSAKVKAAMALTLAGYIASGFLLYGLGRAFERDEISAEMQSMQMQNSVLKTELEVVRAELDYSISHPQIEKVFISENTGEELPFKMQIMNVTAYDLSFASCEKYPDHPEYGITASGKKVQDWYTVAAPKEIPFGTRVYIPYFKDKPNKGVFVVEDRGGAIKTGKLDIFIRDEKVVKNFGRRDLEVYILDTKAQ